MPPAGARPPSGLMRGRVHRPKKPGEEEQDVDRVGPRVADPGHEHARHARAHGHHEAAGDADPSAAALGSSHAGGSSRGVIACRVAEAMVAATALTVVMT